MRAQEGSDSSCQADTVDSEKEHPGPGPGARDEGSPDATLTGGVRVGPARLMGALAAAASADRGLAPLPAQPVKALVEADTVDAGAVPPEDAASNDAGLATATAERLGSPNAAAPIEIRLGASSEAIQIPPSLKERFAEFAFLGQGGMGAVYRAQDVQL